MGRRKGGRRQGCGGGEKGGRVCGGEGGGEVMGGGEGGVCVGVEVRRVVIDNVCKDDMLANAVFCNCPFNCMRLLASFYGNTTASMVTRTLCVLTFM